MSSQESKSRSGRFDLPANELVEKFNATIPFEQRVCPFDIKDSQTHAAMLARQALFPKRMRRPSAEGLTKLPKKSARASLSSPSRTKTSIWRSKSA